MRLGNMRWRHILILRRSHIPEAPGWGTPQMIPRMTQGNAFACQYWDGIISLAENPAKSKTVGKWKYGLVPGSRLSRKLVHRSISSPIAAILVNRYSPRKEQAAMMAMWWATLKNSASIVADRVNTFHDPWHKGHMTDSKVRAAYTPGGVDAIEQNLSSIASDLPHWITRIPRYSGEKSVRSLRGANAGQRCSSQD